MTAEDLVFETDREKAHSKELETLRQKGFVGNLRDLDLTELSTEELLLTLHSYPDNSEVVCKRKIRMGKLGDGGWEVCDDPDVRPREPCVIYSFGINWDFSFDDDVSKVYGCHVYSFDPSMEDIKDKVDRSKLVHFYKIGISNQDNQDPKWQLKTLGNLRSMLKHTRTVIDVLKMDVEGAEWGSLPEMIRTEQFATVRQFMIEYHIVHFQREYLLPKLQVMKDIENAGFKRFYTHKNPSCIVNVTGFPVVRSKCYEVYYIRR